MLGLALQACIRDRLEEKNIEETAAAAVGCFMTGNDDQGRWILARGWLPAKVVEQAFSELRRRGKGDLCAVLVERNLLTLGQAQAVREAVNPGAIDSNPAEPPASLMASNVARGPIQSPGGFRPSGRYTRSAVSGRIENPTPNEELLPSTSDWLRQTLIQGSQGSLVGQRFGPYKILDEISRGGMGLVVKARSPKFNQTVALKLLLNEDGRESQYRRFQREAQVLAKLRHPNIVSVKNYGIEGEIPYFVMTYIDGRDLKSVVEDSLRRHGSVPAYTWTVSVFQQLAEALAYVHAQKVVHRDVKPANVVIESGTERPILVDFGLVKNQRGQGDSATERSLSLSRSGEVRGTPSFMAPEQVDPDGDFGSIGQKTDVWGVGAALFFCLTGQPPYTGNTPANIFVSLMTKDPPRAQDINELVPSWLDELCNDCLQRESDQRLTMNELVVRLNLALSDASGVAFRPLRIRSKALIPAVVLAFLVSVGAFVASLWFVSQDRQRKFDRRQLGRLTAMVRKDVEQSREQLDTIEQEFWAQKFTQSARTKLLDLEANLERSLTIEEKRLELSNNMDSALIAGHFRGPLTQQRNRAWILNTLWSLNCEQTTDDLKAKGTKLEQLELAGSQLSLKLWALALVNKRRGINGAARSTFEELMLKAPQHAFIYLEYANFLNSLSLPEEAVVILRRGLTGLKQESEKCFLTLRLCELTVDESERRAQLKSFAKLAQSADVNHNQRQRAVKMAWSLKSPDLAVKLLQLSQHSPKGIEEQLAQCQVDIQQLAPLTAMARLDKIEPELPKNLRLRPFVQDIRLRACRQDFQPNRYLELSRKALADLPNTDILAKLKLLAGRAFMYEVLDKHKSAQRASNNAHKIARASSRLDQNLLIQLDIFMVSRECFMATARANMWTSQMREAGPEAASAATKRSSMMSQINSMIIDATEHGFHNDTETLWCAYSMLISNNIQIADARLPKLKLDSHLARMLKAKRRIGPGYVLKPRTPKPFIEAAQKLHFAPRGDAVMHTMERLGAWLLARQNNPVKPSVGEMTRLRVLRRSLATQAPFDPMTSVIHARTQRYFEESTALPHNFIDNAVLIDNTNPVLLEQLAPRINGDGQLAIYMSALKADLPGYRDPLDTAALCLKIAANAKGQNLQYGLGAIRRVVEIAPLDKTLMSKAESLWKGDLEEFRRYQEKCAKEQQVALRTFQTAQEALQQENWAEAASLASQCRRSLPLSERLELSKLLGQAMFRASNNTRDQAQALPWLMQAACLTDKQGFDEGLGLLLDWSKYDRDVLDVWLQTLERQASVNTLSNAQQRAILMCRLAIHIIRLNRLPKDCRRAWRAEAKEAFADFNKALLHFIDVPLYYFLKSLLRMSLSQFSEAMRDLYWLSSWPIKQDSLAVLLAFKARNLIGLGRIEDANNLWQKITDREGFPLTAVRVFIDCSKTRSWFPTSEEGR